jgi:hypothetical protein
MDKETIIRICNRLRDGNTSIVSTTEVSMLLTDYCLEHGKPLDKISQFITYLINTPFTTNCVLIALEYYKKKFNVTELKRGNEVLLTY